MNVQPESPSKFGSCESTQKIDARDAAVEEGEGISYAFDKTEKKSNAADAHWVNLQGDLDDYQVALLMSLFKITVPRAATLVVGKYVLN